MKKMKRISAKILLSLTIILTMMPFSFINVKAENEQYTEVTVTASTSRTFWEEDPEDSRYMIGKQYVSFNTSPASAGIIKIRFTTQNPNYNNNYSSPTLYSPNGIDCRYIGDIYGSSSDVWTYGNEFLIQWIDLQEFMLIYEYKVLKTVYNSTTLAEITYNGLITTGSYSNLNLRIIPSLEGLTPAEIELINQNIELLVLNENLSDQAIEEYLQQINQNYLPTIIDQLDAIKNKIDTSINGDFQSYIYVKNTASLNMTNNSAGSFYYPTYQIDSQYGAGFEITNTGKVKCNFDGYVIIANNAYYFRYTTANVNLDVYWTWCKNGNQVTGNNMYDFTFGPNIRGGYTGGTNDIIQVEEGDILDFKIAIRGGQPLTYMDSSSALIYYLSKDTADYTGVLSDQLRTQMLIYNTLQEIKSMIPTQEQNDEIDLNYQEITNIDNTVNNITNTYNQDIDLQMDNIPLTDLPDHTGTNLINTSNLYNTIFGNLINIPDMKGIIALLILCIVILAILG